MIVLNSIISELNPINELKDDERLERSIYLFATTAERFDKLRVFKLNISFFNNKKFSSLKINSEKITFNLQSLVHLLVCIINFIVRI
jgi:hypothetical protein